MVKVNLYTTPTCMPCKILKKKLESISNIELNVFNALEHPEKNIMATPHVEAYYNDELIYDGHVNNINWFVNLIKEKSNLV